MRVSAYALIITLLFLLEGCKQDKQSSNKHDESVASITVKRLIITDDDNHPRMMLGLSSNAKDAKPQITLLDREGNQAVILELDEQDQGRLVFNAKNVDAAMTVGSVPIGDDVATRNTLWGIRVIRPTDSKNPIKILP